VQTRMGLKVEILKQDAKNALVQPIIGIITHADGLQTVGSWECSDMTNPISAYSAAWTRHIFRNGRPLGVRCGG
jgi:hypothetical protein